MRFPRCLLFCTSLLGVTSLVGQTVSDKIRLDQFGYLPWAEKIAVVADPAVGFDAAESYTPGEVFELRRVGDEAVVWSGAPAVWKEGAVHDQSGDRAWWVDFSEVSTPGTYHLVDVANATSSGPFVIGREVYREVLKHAARTFFYQRSGFAKEAEFAGEKWTDGAAFLRPNQDIAARPINDRNNAAAERDLRGGWFDAGDYNKYTEWAGGVVLQLLMAIDEFPHAFDDDYGIPESGNGVPDLLDEVRWKFDWMLRMQEPSGALLGKVAVTGYQGMTPPSADTNARFYGPVSTEATAIGAAAFALGATVFERAGLRDYAAVLDSAARAAWDWCEAHPDVAFDNTGFGSNSPATDDYGRLMNRLSAAVMLFERTGEAEFADFIAAHYLDARPMQWYYFYGFEGRVVKILTRYAHLPQAAPAITGQIRSRLATSLRGTEFMTAANNRTDVYRAYLKDSDYVWGSLSIKTQIGMIYFNGARLGVSGHDPATLRSVAAGYLHHVHGVNALGKVMLTNMNDHGAQRSLDQIYHGWFFDGSIWDSVADSPNGPPPGYLPGGANGSFSPGENAVIEPPMNQPVQKAYRDWNTVWPDSSWQITEPAIGYQAAYVHLLAAFVAPSDAYGDWAATIAWGNTPYAQRRAAADPNRSGWSNHWTWVFDEDPLAESSPRLPVVSHEATTSTLRLWAGASRRLPVSVATSTNLDTWTPLSPSATEGEWEHYTVERDGAVFFQLSVPTD